MVVDVRRPVFEPDYSRVVVDASGVMLRAFLSDSEQWQFPPDFDAPIPEKLRIAVLTFEDSRFYDHPGIDVVAVGRAFFQNLVAGRRISGASTITMQVARLADPKPRTVLSKLREVFQSLKLEILYEKDEILTLYLAHAPYGGNIRGVRAAGLLYFGKEPRELTWAEAATIAVLPNAPTLISPELAPDALQAKRNRLLRRLHLAGHFDEDVLTAATAEPIPRGRVALPFLAPHATHVAANRSDAAVVETTLVAGIQERVTRLVGTHAAQLQAVGVDNAAAIVVDTESGGVVAYVGSQNYFDDERDGKVDGVRSTRSTGSVLKPFLYAAAMDAGIMIPESLLIDVPTYFGTFTPRNIDRQFRGVVRASDALRWSLNVPATRVLSEYGLEAFYALLSRGGLTSLFRPAAEYGLPLILGGAEGSPWDIAALYRGLANLGEFSPIHLLQSRIGTGYSRPLISEGAAYLTLEVMREVDRPGVEGTWRLFESGIPVAWKTGTSYGRRDAWSAGVNAQWTVVVWVGNFEGRENADLSSAANAAPLLFDIFNALPNDPERPVWFSAPVGSLREVETCLATGYRATEHCPETTTAWMPAQAAPLEGCPFHATIHVTNDGEFRVDADCWQAGNHRPQSVLLYPPTVIDVLRRQGAPTPDVPPWAEACRSAEGAPVFLQPAMNAEVYLPRNMQGVRQRFVARVATSTSGPIYWHLDGRYLRSTTDDHAIAIELSDGVHSLTAIDERGGRASVRFSVAGGSP